MHQCPECLTDFYHRKSVRVFCSKLCWQSHSSKHPNKGAFPAGVDPVNKTPVGTERIRNRYNRPDGPRVWVKVAEPNVWKLRAVVVWEAVNGPVPAGHVVHHRSRDTLDDSIGNLEALDRATHLLEHRQEFDERRLAGLRRTRTSPRAA